MNLIRKFHITVIFGLSICLSVSAFDSFQEKKQLIQMQNEVQIDSATKELNEYAKTVTGSDSIVSNRNSNFKLTDNTVLDRSYNSENESLRIDNYYNLNLSFDASTMVLGTDDLKFKLNSIIDQNSDSGIHSSFISVDWTRLSGAKFRYAVSLAHTGKSYNPTLVYIMQKGNLALNKKITYGWTATEASLIKRHTLHVSNRAAWNYSRSLIESNFLKVDWILETSSANIFNLSLFNDYNNVEGSFNILRDIEIPRGTYANQGIKLRYEMENSKILKTNFELTARELYNSKGYSLSINPSWSISQNFRLSTGVNLHHYRFNGDETLRLVLPYLRTNYSLNSKLSVDLFSQYNTETNRLALNSNLSYALKGGHSLNLSCHHNKIVEVANPFLKTPDQNSNILFLKYTYSFAN